MFRGIDNDEAAFLEFASKQQAEIDSRRFAVTAEVKEFRVSFFFDGLTRPCVCIVSLSALSSCVVILIFRGEL
jgi:hypothetical protein